MNKLSTFLPLVVLFLASCNSNGPVACTEDAKLCPDGTAVGRIPPNCEFAGCPSEKSDCDYNNEIKKYVGKSQDECSRIRFICEQSREYFSDECGCGCKLKEGKNEIAENYCTPEQKKADVCIELYKPVCGWFDPNIKEIAHNVKTGKNK